MDHRCVHAFAPLSSSSIRRDVYWGEPKQNSSGSVSQGRASPRLGLKVTCCVLVVTEFSDHAKCIECSVSENLGGGSWCAAPQSVMPAMHAVSCANKTFTK